MNAYLLSQGPLSSRTPKPRRAHLQFAGLWSPSKSWTSLRRWRMSSLRPWIGSSTLWSNCTEVDVHKAVSCQLTEKREGPSARFDDQICLNWNSKGCTFPNCLRRHVCLLCRGFHTKSNHPDARAGLVPSIRTAGLSSDRKEYSAPKPPPSNGIASESPSHGYDNQC